MAELANNQPRVVAIALAMNGIDCQVLIEGIDVSRYCRAVTVRAVAGEATAVHLDVLAGVEILGEAGEVLRGLPEAPAVRIDTVAIDPGDLVVARVDGIVSEAVRQRLDAQLAAVFPHNRIAVLGAGITLSVYRGAGDPGGGVPGEGGASTGDGGAGSTGGG